MTISCCTSNNWNVKLSYIVCNHNFTLFLCLGKQILLFKDMASKTFQKESPLKEAKLSVFDNRWTNDGISRLLFKQTDLPNIRNKRPQLLV